jgi:queuine/archaeosine tRNA-ribosyltransferase
LLRELSNRNISKNPFENVLINPLFSRPETINLVRKLREDGTIKNLYFDSGGYQVQKGIVSYYTLYDHLLRLYQANDWADYYVLPDCPPTSIDNPKNIQHKVRLTVEGGRQFYWEIPCKIRDKAIGVVQGRNLEEVHYCLVNYKQLGIKRLGFGSFITRGSDSGVNVLDGKSLESIALIRRCCPEMELHTFGVGNPPTAYILGNMGVDSFDSSGWIKAAAYGNIYFPFTRAYNVSFRRIEKGNGTLSEDAFLQLKDLTRHECPFCQDFREISRSRDKRLLHNLLAMLETVEAMDEYLHAESVISQWSPKYMKLLQWAR